MRRVARLSLTIVVLALVAASAAAAVPVLGPQTTITVRPASGPSTTRFGVRFRNPVASGRHSDMLVREVVSVTGPRQPTGSGCRRTATATLPAAGLHQSVRGSLAPGASGWCAGRFSGTVTEFRQIVCGGPPTAALDGACPEIAFAPVTLGRFGFTVTRATA